MKLLFSSLGLRIFQSFYNLTSGFLFYHAFLISFDLLLQACLCDSRPSGGCGWNPSCGSQCQFLASQWLWLYHQSARWKVCLLLLMIVGAEYWHLAIGKARTQYDSNSKHIFLLVVWRKVNSDIYFLYYQFKSNQISTILLLFSSLLETLGMWSSNSIYKFNLKV